MTNVLLEKKGNIAVATINRPKALNALNSDVLTDLGELVDIVNADSEIRALVITGSGHRLLCALLSQKLTQREKLNIIEKEYDIPLEDNIRKDVSVMCNLSQGIVDETRDETRAEIIMNMFKKGYTMEQIADVTDKSVAEIEEIVKKESVLA